MNRDIKFRCWNEIAKKMHQLQRMNFINGQLLYVGYNVPTPKEYKEHYKVMQYIGKNDKDGIEIYEEDFVEALNRNYDCEDNRESYFRIFRVTYLNGCFMFGGWNAHEFFNKHMYIKVVGNVYENEGMKGDRD